MVWGRLYHLHAGFSALEVPEGLILAQGAADPMAGARRQQEIGTPRFGRPTGDWDLIHGELVTFTDPQHDLPPIDRLEGFRPGGHSIDGGGAVRAHLDSCLDLLDAMPTLRGKNRQLQVVTPVSVLLRPYLDESV